MQLALLMNSTKHLREETTPVLHKPFQKPEEVGRLFTSLSEVSVSLKPKLDKKSQEKKMKDQYPL